MVDPTTGAAPDWVPTPTVVTRKIPGGTVVRRYSLGRGQDTLELSVEVETTADAVALRALVGTSGSLTLPHARYDNADYGTGTGYPDGRVYRTQTVYLAAIGASAITIRQTVRLTLSFERQPQ